MSMEDVQLEQLKMLRSIDSTMKQLLELSRARKAPASAPAKGAAVASDADLDGKYGNPNAGFDPRDWSGPSQKGKPLSDCPPDFLDMLAETLDYFAEKAEKEGTLTANGKPVAPYKRLDASRARGWALRIRSGKHKPAPESEEPQW